MKITFLPQNLVVEGSPDKTLLKIATENHLEIRSICKGVPSCAECRVKIKEGESNILPPSKAELSLIGTSHFIDGRRLSCQVRCFGDVVVDLTEQIDRSENQVKKIRGFRSQKQVESHAVNDTMLLSEKPDPKQDEPKAQAKEPREQQPPEGQRNQQRDQRRENRQGPRQDRRPQQKSDPKDKK